MMRAARESGARILPVDSEHNAVFQCFSEKKFVRKIVLTASGGPFRAAPLEALASVTPEQACAHPNWSMGRKISVDSATMMNKGLEVIEARWLFDLAAERIEVLVHPQSIVHSLVEYVDGSVLAQLSNPDMRVPIAHARLPGARGFRRQALDLAPSALVFERRTWRAFRPRSPRGPARAHRRSATANEIAVEAFCRAARVHRNRRRDRRRAGRGPRRACGRPRAGHGSGCARAARGQQARHGACRMSLLHTIVAFIIALGLLIVVHEYGHYLVARLCGVKVLRFSVGFGRALLTKKIGSDQTEWVIAAIPFGGYVKMLDEREGEVPPHEAHRAFNRQSVWRRVGIVVAGPLANFLFAVAAYAGLFMYGLPEARPVLGAPPEGTVAAAAGIRTGDTVRAVGGEAIATWQELRWRVLQSALQREPLRLEIIDDKGHLRDAALDLRAFPADDVEADALERIGLRLYRPRLEPVIGQLVRGGAASAPSRRATACCWPTASWSIVDAL
jgi:hypothetical protein